MCIICVLPVCLSTLYMIPLLVAATHPGAVSTVQIKINGSHFTDFVHRMPKETAQFLVIDGEVAVSFIRFSGLHGDANVCSLCPPSH